jgi:hypothetical protein
MGKIYLFMFTRSTAADEPGIFCSHLSRCLPEAIPEVFFKGEDETTPFADVQSKKAKARLFAEYWRGGVLSWSRRKPDIYGSASYGTDSEHTGILHTFDQRLATGEECRRFLSELMPKLEGDYAYVHVIPSPGQKRNPIDKMLGGATALNIQSRLPGVPWAAWYGPPYVKLFGKKTLLSVPAHETSEIRPGIIYCQLTADLTDIDKNPGSVLERQEAMLDHLGRDAFFDPANRDRKGRVPAFTLPIVQVLDD